MSGAFFIESGARSISMSVVVQVFGRRPAQQAAGLVIAGVQKPAH
jgi:hypothetical protein